MIKVSIVTKNGSFASMEAKGHAGSAPYGQDLVCAAISAIILGGFNALEESQNFHAEAKEGYASLQSLKTPSLHDAIVIETMIKQIDSVATSYPKNVTLERKNTQ